MPPIGLKTRWRQRWDGIDYGLRLLAGCGVIQINEPLAADWLVENGEVFADTLDVKLVSG